MAQRSYYSISVGGQDISSILAPILISLTVTDKSGTSSDTCSIEIDDTDGRVVMPATGAEIVVVLGRIGGTIREVFRGKVDEVRSRGGARTLSISAKGADSNGKAKQPQSRHMDNKTLEQALQEAGRAAGITDIRVDQQLRSLQRPYWAMDAESFMHFGERLAREVGGVFKISGARAVMARRGSGQSPSGQSLPSITATWGENLLDWDISPKLGRSQYRETRARYYNPQTASWQDVRVQVPTEGAEAQSTHRHTRANRGEAQSQAQNDSASADANKGGGSVTIDGDASAMPEGTCQVQGARPGIDGAYRIESVEHNLAGGSSGGFTTKLTLKQPSGGAGRDRRSRSGSGSVAASASSTPAAGSSAGGVGVN